MKTTYRVNAKNNEESILGNHRDYVLLHFVVRGAVNPAPGIFNSNPTIRPSDRNGPFADRQEDEVSYREQRTMHDQSATDCKSAHSPAEPGIVYVGWEWDGT